MLGKALTTAAAGNAAGAGEATYVEDVFSTYLYTGNGTSQVIENGINLGAENSGGSGYFDGSEEYLKVSGGTSLDFGTGDLTVECWVYPKSLGSPVVFGQIDDGGGRDGVAFGINSATTLWWLFGNGSSWVFQRTPSYSTPLNAWTHLAVTRSGSTAYLFANGVLIDSVSDSTSLSQDALDLTYLGGIPQAGYDLDGYLSNVRVVKGTALYTSAFTPTTSPLTAVAGTSLLTLQGTEPFVDNSSNAHTITVNGDATAKAFGPFTSDTEGEGGLVWLKNRDATFSHTLYDTERGATKYLISNATNTESTISTGLTSFNANGFTHGSHMGTDDVVSWTFAKQEKFFDVMTVSVPSASYVADAITVDHSLNAIPGMVIVKDTAQTSNWWVWHKDLTGNNYLKLHLTDAIQDFGADWINVTDTQVKLHGWFAGNQYASGDLVIYVFAHNDGDGIFGENGDQDIIKCGSYTGTGSVGLEVNLGFEPQWLMVKRSDSTGSWYMIDTMRGMPVGGNDKKLEANDAGAESEGLTEGFAPTATGFKLEQTWAGINASGGTYIYIAIRRGPMKTPESGTEVFAQDYRHDATPAYTSGFPVDWAFQKRESGTTTTVRTRMLGTNYLDATSTVLQTTLSTITWDYNDGMESHTSDQTDKWMWMFRRAPGFFDVVAYTGNNAARTINHNLGVVPEMIWIKNREQATDWIVYNKDLNGGSTPESYHLHVNLSSAEATNSIYFNNTAPTNTVFSIGADGDVNNSTRGYIAYLFATVPGVSKVGSYIGNGTSQTIDCGFSTGARFVMIKRTDSTGDWHVYDSERGIVAGNDPRLEINTADAEDTGSDDIDPVSSGFSVTSNADVNTNTAEYIFLAIA